MLRKYRWFVVFVFLALVLGAYYYVTTIPIYERKAAVIVTDDEASSISSQFSQFSAFGVSTGGSNVYNEIVTFKSPAYMYDVVKQLNLDIDYRSKGIFRDAVLYGKSLPVRVTMVDLLERESATMDIDIVDNNTINLSGFTLNGENDKKIESDKTIKAHFNTMISTPIGKVMVSKTEFFATAKREATIHVTRSPAMDIAQKYVSRLYADLIDVKASVIEIILEDESAQRAEDMLYALLDVYNKKWIDNINQQAVSTSQFIDEELEQIERELGNEDNDISDFKSRNNVPDVAATTAISLDRAEKLRTTSLDLNNQIFIAKYIKKQLVSGNGSFQTLPANAGINNPSVSQQIVDYNKKVSERNNLIENSGPSNPIVVELDKTLVASKKAIMASLDNVIAQLSNQISDLRSEQGMTSGQISSSPGQARYLLSVERQQKVKEQLYVFLLQKRAENQMTKAYNSKTRLINPPAGGKKHIRPVKINVIVISLALGFLIPLLILTLMYNLDTTIKQRRDLENLVVPYIGEIPLNYKGYSGIFSFLNKKKERHEIVVKEKSNNIINEAFRVVRTNMEFVTTKGKKCNVVMFTSAFPGSGKTFVSANLATAFALNGKKVLYIDLDLRKGTSSKMFTRAKVGISNYLSGNISEIEDIMVKGKTVPNLDVIPIGVVPPNPTELLYGNLLEDLLNTLRVDYDYIFLDCPPLGIVADASIITKLCDMTIFVIRAGLFQRNMLPELNSYYEEKRYRNLVVLLNGVKQEYHGYGYYGNTYGGYAKAY
ncbi:MAG: polysaccharide biosynthesis tyrosine autokinase [Bacteroidales bacterium]|nr:polysaccharide biosynthesis tyrosine autokinase [Candidatus Sodaliphilus aphodohippi]